MYRVTNHYRNAQSYKASNGREIRFEPGETKKVKTPPPDSGYWSVEEMEESSNQDQSEDGGEQ